MLKLSQSFAMTLSIVAGLSVAACDHAEQTHAVGPSPAPIQAREIPEPGPQPRVPNTPVASNVQISEEILRACDIPDADAYFAFDSSHLTRFDAAPLDALATCFRTGPLAGRRMKLVGHADPRGASDYNLTLGQSRADAVAAYLQGRGLRSDAIGTTSRGAMDATGQDETGWAHDRRVDVLLGT